MTPSILPNWESEPQNQPRANVAVSTAAGVRESINGFSGVMPGVGVPLPAPEQDASTTGKPKITAINICLTISHLHTYIIKDF